MATGVVKPGRSNTGSKPGKGAPKGAPVSRFVSWQNYPSGEGVTADNALSISEILACVRVLAEEIAALPLEIRRRSDGVNELARDLPVFDLLHSSPNPEQTAYEFRCWLVIDAILRGTGYAQVLRNADGEILELWPLLAQRVAPVRSPADGSLWWQIGDAVIPDADMFRFQIFPYGSVISASLIDLQSGSLGSAKAANDVGGEFIKNSGLIGAFVQAPSQLSAEAFERLKSGIREWNTQGRRGGMPVLEGGTSIVPLSLNAQEAQLLEARKYNRTQIAGLFRVPPHMIGDLERATFSNIEQQDLGFYRHTLRPLLTAIQQRVDKTLLTKEQRDGGVYSHFDLSDLLRADVKTQAEADSVDINSGVKRINEVRKARNLPPVEGGDQNFVQGALRPITQPYQSSSGAPAST